MLAFAATEDDQGAVKKVSALDTGAAPRLKHCIRFLHAVSGLNPISAVSRP